MAKGKKTGGKDWEKGKSANPNGRPKKGETFTDILSEYVKRERGKEATEWLVERLVTRSEIDTSPTALIAVLERLFGKVSDVVKHEGDPDNPQKVIIEIVRSDKEDNS